jgi:DNA recombination protein RmuC
VGEGTSAEAEKAVEAVRESHIAQLSDRDHQMAELKLQLAAERQSVSDAQSRYLELTERYARLETLHREQQRTNEEAQKRLLDVRTQMTDQFKILSSEILKTHGETFSQQNKEQVSLLLKPLQERIEEFKTGLTKDRAELVEQVRTLHESTLNMTQEANNLTKALKGNAQTQGAWGEMILTSILERSGLQKGVQYTYQETHSTEDQGRVRTDVEVLLPNNESIVVDSKVSLTAFDGYVNAVSEEDRAARLRDHITSVRNHVRTLSDKEYHRHSGSGLDFVIMFLPIESAFAVAVTEDPAILDLAFNSGVVLCTPTTLMTVLRTIRNIWQVENRTKNAEQIADRAGKLYDKVVGFLDNMEKLDGSLVRSRQAFDKAKGQLISGSGSVLRQVELLKQLGARTNKELPANWETVGADLPETSSLDAGVALFLAAPPERSAEDDDSPGLG